MTPAVPEKSLHIVPGQKPNFPVAGCSPYKLKFSTGWKDLRQDFCLVFQSPGRCRLLFFCRGTQAFQCDLTRCAPDMASAPQGAFCQYKLLARWRMFADRA